MAYYLSSATTVAYIDTGPASKTIFLPSTFNIQGKQIYFKDIANNAQNNNITLATLGGDRFENNLSNYVINQNLASVSFVARNGKWYSLTGGVGGGGGSGGDVSMGVSSLSSIVSYGLSSLRADPGISSLSSILSYGLSSLGGQVAPGVSSLSSIVSYGLSSLITGPGISSLSSVVSYGLSSLITGPGISSLSSVVSYGLSSLITGPGISSLSSIVSYGLSSVRADPGISSLSSIISYGLSTVYNFANSLSNANVYATISSLSSVLSYGLSSIKDSTGTALVPGLSSLSSVVSYGLSSIYNFANSLSNANVYATISSLSSVLSYGLSSIRTDPGISSLSSIISYGLSSLGGQTAPGISSLSSIVSYGLSSLRADTGISSLSSIVSYGLSSLGGQTAPGISSLSSLVSYGLSSLRTDPGISSLSSIVSYGLSSLGGQTAPGISSLSSIVSYGLSSLRVDPGISSLSSLVSYGLSSLRVDPGISSLSSIVSYGLSSLGGQTAPGISSLSSLVSYGLSSLRVDPGISSLSSIVSYGLSSLGGLTSPGISSLSSVVSYGLSSLITASGISSLSSIVSYGLSSLRTASGISSLSSVVSYGLSSLRTAAGISSLSSVVSYGLSSLRSASGISSLSSIVSYGLSSFIIPLSTFSTAISTRFTTSSFQANVISSSYGAFSTLSTGNILVGYVTSPLQVDVGVTTGDIVASTVTMNYGYVETNLGIGKEAPYWYALDVSGASRLPVISSVLITAGSFIGDGSQVINAPNPGVSSLSSIVSYGLSSLGGQTAPGISSLSSIVSYGLSSIIEYVDSLDGKNIVGGLSSLSSVVSYGLSSVYDFANSLNNLNLAAGLSSLSSIVSYGLSSLGGEVGPGVSSLSSIVSYGLSSLGGLVAPGLSTLSSIVSFGLSSLITDPGVSSLSSIVSYGLSSLISAPGLSSLSSIVGYGISSAVISSLTVSENWPIKEYSIGAPGFSTIDVSPSNNPDTVTNAIGKIDKWIYTTLLDQPDTPIVTNSNFGIVSSNTYLLLFKPPFQFKVNFMDMWMPFISSLNVSVYNRSTGSNVYFYALSDKNYLPNSPVGSNTQGIFLDALLAFSNEKVGYTYTRGGVTYSNLLYCPISNVSVVDDNYDIFLYYANYSALTLHNTSNPWIISLSAYPPSSPNGLGMNVINRNSLVFSFILSNVNCNDPNMTTGGGGTYQFMMNQITFSNLNNSVFPRRYNTVYVPQTTTVICNAAPFADRGSNVAIQQDGFNYDTFYSFRARVQNAVSGNYSLDSSNSGSNKTDLPAQPLRITSIDSNIQSTWLFPTAGILAADNFTTTYNVLQYSNISNAGGIVHNINLNNSIAIHTDSNPGSSSQNIASLQVITSNVSRLSNTLNLNGWSAQSLPYTSNMNGAQSFITTTVRDYYMGDSLRSNFYLVGSNTRVTINCNFLLASNVAYSYTINHSNLSNTTISCNFGPYYVDDIRGLPVLLSVSNYRDLPDNFYNDYISGILSLRTTTQFSFNIDLSNYARYFLPDVTNFLTVSIGSNGNLPVFETTNSGQTSNFYTLTDTEISAPPYPTAGLRFKMSNYFVTVDNNYWTSNSDTVLYAQVTARSLVGSMTTTQDLPFYYDLLSVNNRTVAVDRYEANSNQNSCNFKAYINSSLIYGASCNLYNYELPLVGGYYRAGSNASQYYRHLGLFTNQVTGSAYPISYSNIGRSVDVSTRYAMFKYTFSNSARGTSNIKLLRFSFCNDFDINFSNTPNCNFGNTIPFLKYKIHNAGIFNTEWLDGNSTKQSYLAFDSDTAINNAAGLRSNNCNTQIVSDARFFSMIPVTPGNDFDVYVKIGLNRLCNARFDFINMSSIVGITPPGPSNLLLDTRGSTNDPLEYTLTWRNYTFPDRTPMISNIISLSNIYNNSSRRYPYVYRDTLFDEISNITYQPKSYFNSLSRGESNAFGSEANQYIFYGMTFGPYYNRDQQNTYIELYDKEFYNFGDFRELAKLNRVSPRCRLFSAPSSCNFLYFLCNDTTGCNFASKFKGFIASYLNWDTTTERFDSSVVELSNIISTFGTRNIESISVQNEAYYRLRDGINEGKIPNPTDTVLATSFNNYTNYIVDLKNVLSNLKGANPVKYQIVPVGMVETGSFIRSESGLLSNRGNVVSNAYYNMIGALDFIGLNSHPKYRTLDYNDNFCNVQTSADRCINLVKNDYNTTYTKLTSYPPTNPNYARFQSLANNIIIAETSMPSDGFTNEGYYCTMKLQELFTKGIIEWQNTNNIKVYIFTATDNPENEGEMQRHLGLYSVLPPPRDIVDIQNYNTPGDVTTNVQFNSGLISTIVNCDTWYNVKIHGLNDAGLGSCNTPYSNISDLPSGGRGFYNVNNGKFTLGSAFNCNYKYPDAYAIGSVNNRVYASSIISINDAYLGADSTTLYISSNNKISGRYVDFCITSSMVEQWSIVNFSNSSVGERFPGIYLSNFIFNAALSNNGIIQYNTAYRFNNDLYNNKSKDTDVDNTSFSNTVNSNFCMFVNTPNDNFGISYTFSGFLLRAKPRIRIFSGGTDIIKDDNQPYRFVMSNNYGCNIWTDNYWFDDFSTDLIPRITVFGDIGSMTNSNYYSYVTGVASYRTDRCNFNFWIRGSNLGNRFFHSNAVSASLVDDVANQTVASFNFDLQTTRFYRSNSLESSQLTTAVSINNLTYFYWSDVDVGSMCNFYYMNTNQLWYTVTRAKNLNSEPGFVTTDLTDMYVDTVSLATISKSSSSNFSSNYVANTNCNWGERVTSGVGSFPFYSSANPNDDQYYGAQFSQCNYLDENYVNELQLAGGLYCGRNTTASINSYYDYSADFQTIPGANSYPDYTTIGAATRRRYATFNWYITSNDVTGNGGQATKGVINIVGHNIPSSGAASFWRFTPSNVSFQYRIRGVGTGSSGWLDANVIYSGVRNSTWFTTNGCNGGTNPLSGGAYTNSCNIRNVWLYGDDPNQGKTPFYLYVRIGFPANCNYYFSNVRLLSVNN